MQAPQSNYHLLAKPAGAACNLGCQYCFFLSKENLYAGKSHLMTDEMLDTYLQQLMESSPGPQVDVAWQGGEPMLRGLDFYRRSVELAEQVPQAVSAHPAHDPDQRHADRRRVGAVLQAEQLSRRAERGRAARDA